MILEVSLDRAGGRIERHDGAGVEIISGALIAHPGAAIAGAPERQIGLGIIGASDPDRGAAGLPLIALRPCFAAGLARCRHHVGLPQLLAGLRIIGGDEAPHAELPAGDADQNLAVNDKRRQRHVVALLVISDLRGPRFLAGLGIERDQHRVRRRKEHLVAPEPDPTAGRLQFHHVLGDRPPEAPQQLATLGLNREQLVAGRRHEHDAIVDDRRRLMALGLAGGQAPDELQAGDIGRRDLRKRAETPAIEAAPEHQPVAVLRLFQPVGGHRRIILQDGRRRARRRRRRNRADRLLRVAAGEAHYGNRRNADAPHEQSFVDHGTPPALNSCGHPAGVKPTRLVNGLATISLPSVIFKGSAGSGLGAGPATKAPSARGLYCELWQGHSSSLGSASQSVTSQPVCGQIAAYATTPSAAWSLVAPSSIAGSSRSSKTLFRREPLRTSLVAGSIGQAKIGGPPIGTSRGSMVSRLLPSIGTNMSPTFARSFSPCAITAPGTSAMPKMIGAAASTPRRVGSSKGKQAHRELASPAWVPPWPSLLMTHIRAPARPAFRTAVHTNVSGWSDAVRIFQLTPMRATPIRGRSSNGAGE